jgi:hypothetical protein
MTRQSVLALAVSGAALSIGCISLFLLLSSSDWGPPGSKAYLVYEARNRLIPASLLLIGAGVVALHFILRDNTGRLGRVSVTLSLSGVALMLVGNVAEFWLFSGLAYGPMNARALAWSLFLLGGLLLLVGLAMLLVAAGRSTTGR